MGVGEAEHAQRYRDAPHIGRVVLADQDHQRPLRRARIPRCRHTGFNVLSPFLHRLAGDRLAEEPPRGEPRQSKPRGRARPRRRGPPWLTPGKGRGLRYPSRAAGAARIPPATRRPRTRRQPTCRAPIRPQKSIAKSAPEPIAEPDADMQDSPPALAEAQDEMPVTTTHQDATMDATTQVQAAHRPPSRPTTRCSAPAASMSRRPTRR